MRDTLEPKGRTTLLADSGPLFNAPLNGAGPIPLAAAPHGIRSTWGLDGPHGLITTLALKLPGIDTGNMGSLSPALAQKYPNDRFGYMVFQADEIFRASATTASIPYIQQEPDPASEGDDEALWLPGHRPVDPPTLGTRQEHLVLDPVLPRLQRLALPDDRRLLGHRHRGPGLRRITPFIDANLDRGAVLRKTEVDQVSDLTRPVSPALALWPSCWICSGRIELSVPRIEPRDARAVPRERVHNPGSTFPQARPAHRAGHESPSP